MEQVGINSVQQVQYQPQAASSEPAFTGKKPEMVENGESKLMGALAGLATITAGVLVIRDLKKGDASKLKGLGKKVTNCFNKKGATKIDDAAKKGLASEHTNLSKYINGKTPEEISSLYSSTQKSIQELLNKIKAKQADVSKLAKEISEKQKAYDDLLTSLKNNKGSKTAGLDLAEKMKTDIATLTTQHQKMTNELSELTAKKDKKAKLLKGLKSHMTTATTNTEQVAQDAIDKSIARHNKKVGK